MSTTTLSLLELAGRHSRVLFEVFAESVLLGEAQLVGHLFDLRARLVQQTLGLRDGDEDDP